MYGYRRISKYSKIVGNTPDISNYIELKLMCQLNIKSSMVKCYRKPIPK